MQQKMGFGFELSLFQRTIENLNMQKINFSNLLVALIAVWSLTACGGGGGGGSGAGGGVTEASTSIGVTPGLGAFSAGATVEAFKTDGTLLGSGTTDSNGKIVGLTVPSSYTDAIILRVKGGTGVNYFDEGKNEQVDLAASEFLMSVLPAGTLVADAKFGITPLTNLMAGLAGVDTAAATPRFSVSAADANLAVSAALKKVQAMTGLVDFDFTTAPNPLKDLSAQRDAANKSDLYGVLLAEMAKLAGSEGAFAQANKMFQSGKSAKDAADSDAFDTHLGNLIQSVQIASSQLETNSLLTNTGNSDAFKKLINASAVAVKPKDLFGSSDLNQLLTSRSNDLASQVTLRASKPLGDLQGVWDTAAQATLPASALITPDGRFIMRMQPTTTSDRIVMAQFKPTSSGYAASGLDVLLKDDKTTVTEVTLNIENVSARTSMTLQTSKSGQASENFVLSYSNRYEAAISLADFTGTWTDVVADYAKVTWTVNNKGEFTGTSSSSKQCTWAGKISLRNEARGVANVVVKETCGSTSAELKGLLTFKSGSSKSTARVTVMNSSGSKVLLLELSKS